MTGFEKRPPQPLPATVLFDENRARGQAKRRRDAGGGGLLQSHADEFPASVLEPKDRGFQLLILGLELKSAFVQLKKALSWLNQNEQITPAD